MIEELEKRYKNNLLLFKKYLPNIYEVLKNNSNQNYQLHFNKNNINISKNGKLIYPNNTKEYFNTLISSYKDRGNENILEYKMKFLEKDNSKKRFGIDVVHFIYLTKMKENYQNIFNSLPFSGNEELNQDFIYTGIIYGIGLGYHIMPLINKYKFRNLILADIDIEMLRVSLYTIDWIEILQYFANDNTKSLFISIQLPNNQNSLKDAIFYNLYNNQPLSYYNLGEFISYADEDMNDFIYKLRYDIDNRLYGIKRGFFDDEKWGLQHTIHNLKENVPILTNNNIQVDKNKFVFVVGNGPSLDNYIKIIKKYRDNAIIIASGSSINSLYNYNITPDIYVAIERTIVDYDSISDLPKKYLNKIIFIGMNTIHPRLFAQFKNRYMFLKPKDAGTNFINDKEYKILNHSNPTVTNGALSLTIALGFKDICLFGMDFGYKDKKNHHSKNSIYNNKDNNYYKEEFKDEIEIEGVNADTIYTDTTYNNSRKHIELLIENSSKDINIYNFSNGAKIAGTKRVINSKDIKLHKQTIDKKRVLKSIKKQFIIYNKKINIDYNNINKKIKILQKEIKKYNNKNITIYEYLRFFDIFYKLFREEFVGEFQYLKNLFNGTIVTIMGIIYSYISTNKDTKNTSLFINSSLKILNEFLKESKRKISIIENSIDTPFKWRDNG